MLFADLLSLHLVTYSMLFILVDSMCLNVMCACVCVCGVVCMYDCAHRAWGCGVCMCSEMCACGECI